jgi:hypothetical protein
MFSQRQKQVRRCSVLLEYDLAGICVKLRHKPVDKLAQLSFPIRLFSGPGGGGGGGRGNKKRA